MAGKISIVGQIAKIDREIALRQKVYPRDGRCQDGSGVLLSGNSGDLRHLLVGMAFEVKEATGQALHQRNNKTLSRSVICAECVESIVVGLCINSSQNGRLIGGYSGKFASPDRKVTVIASAAFLDFSQQAVVIALQHLMGPGLVARIEDELNCPNNRNRNRRIHHLDSEALENITRGSRAQDNDEKAETPCPELERASARRVIKRISDGVEPQVFSIIVHCLAYFFGGEGAFGAGADGCRGPGPASGFPELVGCRGPKLLIWIFPEGRVTPKDFFDSILIVSMWSVHMVMMASARGCARADADQYQFRGCLS